MCISHCALHGAAVYHVLAWTLQMLLILDRWAMREPECRDKLTVQSSMPFLYVYPNPGKSIGKKQYDSYGEYTHPFFSAWKKKSLPCRAQITFSGDKI